MYTHEAEGQGKSFLAVFMTWWREDLEEGAGGVDVAVRDSSVRHEIGLQVTGTVMFAGVGRGPQDRRQPVVAAGLVLAGPRRRRQDATAAKVHLENEEISKRVDSVVICSFFSFGKPTFI